MNSKHLSLFLFLLAAGGVSASDVVGTWTDTTGNWDVDTNWSSNPSVPGVPGTDFDEATFGPLTPGNYTDHFAKRIKYRHKRQFESTHVFFIC